MFLFIFGLLFTTALIPHDDASVTRKYREQRSNEPTNDEITQEDLFQDASTTRFRREDPAQPCVQGDIVFILDSSGSIGKDNWQLVRVFVSEAASRMTIGPHGTHVGCVTFGNRGHIIFNLNKYTTVGDIQAAVAALPFLDQNTNTSGGLWMAKDIMFTPENGDRPKAPNIAIVITDGESTYDHDKTIPYAEQMKASGILMISIGVGSNVTAEELNGMASLDAHGKPLVYQVGSYALLATLQDKLAKVACEADIASTKLMTPVKAPSTAMSDSVNGCNQDFGPNCPNACGQSGGTCCWCDKAAQNLGLTQTCSCCPVGSQCCPSKNISRVPKCCPSDSICGPAGGDGCYVLGSKSKLGTVQCSNCETYLNPPTDVLTSKKLDLCDSLCKL